MHNHIKILRDFKRGNVRIALFDFDGTLSLIRRGWHEIMVGYFVEVLAALDTGETSAELSRLVDEFVATLTGKQTIYQMLRLAEEVEKRGGKPEQPLVYKHAYHDRLWQKMRSRVQALESGSETADQWLVPGSRALLENLRERGVEMYLASGTDIKYVLNEARLLEIDHFFPGRIHAALDEYQRFSKRQLIERLFRELSLRGDQFVAFGDGYVEIQDTCERDGIAVGVATDESTCDRFEPWKLERLTRAGAHVIVPEFREQDALVRYLWGELELPVTSTREEA